MSAPDDDAVGYRRPPKKNQFRPGQSGNPNGRPKDSRNLTNIIEEELDQKIPVTEGGKRRRVSKRRLAVRQQVNKAAQGDAKAFVAIARLLQNVEAAVVPTGQDLALPETEISDEQYAEALKEFARARLEEKIQ